MAMKLADVPELGLIKLYKRRDCRNLRLSIGHDGTIRVSLPYWLSYDTGIRFAYKQRDWIRSRKENVAPISHGSIIGKAHHIAFVPEEGRSVLSTRITSSGEVRIIHPAHTYPQDKSVQTAAKRASLRSIKQQAAAILPPRLEALARQHNFAFRSVNIRQLKSRWGSCSSEKDIVLNCFLVQLPWRLIDYVMLHELLHTRVMAHGPVFWRELEKYMPDLKQIRREMKLYKPALTIS